MAFGLERTKVMLAMGIVGVAEVIEREFAPANAQNIIILCGKENNGGDGFALASWINGSDSGNCCTFQGGPFTESRYFGEGIGIAVKKNNDTLRLAFNWALFRLWEKGRFIDLWLRYFPISPF